MGALHARKLRARADVELVGVVDPRDLGPGVPQLEAVPDRVDFAVIAVPTAQHVAVALPLAERGVALLIEKPVAPSVEEVDRLEGFDRLSVNHIERYNPALSALPEGFRPRYVRAERLAPWGPRGTDVDVVLDLMVHDLDLVLALDGGEVVELRAVGVPVRSPGVDIAEVWLETSTGLVATLTASRVSRSPTRTLRLVGPEGYYSLDLGRRTAARVRYQEGELDAEAVPVRPQDALEAIQGEFLAAVRGEGAFPVPLAAGRAAVEVAARVTAATTDRLG